MNFLNILNSCRPTKELCNLAMAGYLHESHQNPTPPPNASCTCNGALPSLSTRPTAYLSINASGIKAGHFVLGFRRLLVSPLKRESLQRVTRAVSGVKHLSCLDLPRHTYPLRLLEGLRLLVISPRNFFNG